MSVQPEEKRVAHERRAGYVPRFIPVEQAALHTLFPYRMYWRRVSLKVKVGDKVVNREGMVYPSFSSMVFPAEYRIEMADPESRRRFTIPHARGYAPCPVCGKSIVAVLENYDIELRRRVEKFTSEVAYELVSAALSKEIAARMKAHLKGRHGYSFEKVGTKKVLIVRNVFGQEVLMSAEISRYKCGSDGAKNLIGIYGALAHAVLKHVGGGSVKRAIELMDRAAEVAQKILKVGKVPILGAHRSLFRYRVAKPLSGKFKVYRTEWFRPWLYMRLVSGKKGTEIQVVATIPRPMRMIYHYPVFRPAVHLLAYRISPEKYLRFMGRAERFLESVGVDPEPVRKMRDMVTGGLAYIPFAPRNGFGVDVETLTRFVSTVKRIGDIATVFAR